MKTYKGRVRTTKRTNLPQWLLHDLVLKHGDALQTRVWIEHSLYIRRVSSLCRDTPGTPNTYMVNLHVVTVHVGRMYV